MSAWLMIVINASSLLSALDTKYYSACYASFPAVLVSFLAGYSFLFSVVGITAGAGLLALKEVARKAAIFINAADILVGLPVFILSFSSVRSHIYVLTASQLAQGPPSLDAGMVATAAFDFVVFMNLAVFALNGAFIFFFTRRKIKEQFAAAS